MSAITRRLVQNPVIRKCQVALLDPSFCVFKAIKPERRYSQEEVLEALMSSDKALRLARVTLDRRVEAYELIEATAERNPNLTGPGLKKAEAVATDAQRKCIACLHDRGKWLDQLGQLDEEPDDATEEVSGLSAAIRRYASRDAEQKKFRKQYVQAFHDHQAREDDASKFVEELAMQTAAGGGNGRKTRELDSAKIKRDTLAEHRRLLDDMLTDFIEKCTKEDDDFCSKIKSILSKSVSKSLEAAAEPAGATTSSTKEAEEPTRERNLSVGEPQSVELDPTSIHGRPKDRTVEAQLRWRKAEAKEDLLESYDRHESLRAAYGLRLEQHESKPEPKSTRSEFDRRYLLDLMGATAGIAKAEEAFVQARVDMKEAGIAASRAESSIFADQPDDGYAMSYEAAIAQSIDRNCIEKWLWDVEEGHFQATRPLPAPEGVTVASWAEQEFMVRSSDSLSCVAFERHAPRIRQRQREEKSPEEKSSGKRSREEDGDAVSPSKRTRC